MFHNFLMEHVGCFQVLAIVNSTAMSIEVHMPLSNLVSSVYAYQWDCWVIWQLYSHSFLFSTRFLPGSQLKSSCSLLHWTFKKAQNNLPSSSILFLLIYLLQLSLWQTLKQGCGHHRNSREGQVCDLGSSGWGNNYHSNPGLSPGPHVFSVD